MLHDKAGNRLVRRVNIKIHYPDGILPVQKMVQKAETKKGFSADAIDEILMSVTDMLDTRFPFWEFTMKELKGRARVAEYVFTQIGYRTVVQPSTDNLKSEGSTPDSQGTVLAPPPAVQEPAEETNAPTVV